LLNNGIIVSPVKSQNSGPEARSLRDIIGGINNEADMKQHIAREYGRFPRKPAELKYERNQVSL